MTQAQMLRLGMLIEHMLSASEAVYDANPPRGRAYKPAEVYTIPGSALGALQDARLKLARWCHLMQTEPGDGEAGS